MPYRQVVRVVLRGLVKIITFLTFLVMVVSCRNENDMLIGKWKQNASASKNGVLTITFFSRNLFTKIYSSSNNVVIENDGIWEYGKRPNTINLKPNDKNNFDKYVITKLNTDSLIWEPIDTSFVSEPMLFLKIK